MSPACALHSALSPLHMVPGVGWVQGSEETLPRPQGTKVVPAQSLIQPPTSRCEGEGWCWQLAAVPKPAQVSTAIKREQAALLVPAVCLFVPLALGPVFASPCERDV